jgi:hypothetical protein
LRAILAHHLSARGHVFTGVNEQQVGLNMTTPLFPSPSPEPATIVAEGRVLDAVATHDLRGTVDQIADRLSISPGNLRAAISALGAIGWIETTYQSDGQIWLCLADDLR